MVQNNIFFTLVFSKSFSKLDIYFIVVFLYKAPQCQAEPFVGADTPVHAVHCPWCLVFVDLFPLSLARTRQSTHGA